MHLYLYVRGKFEQIELWKSLVQSAFWKWRRINNKTGKEEIILVQGGLRPSVLGAYEYIFPKEALAEVCSFLGIRTNPPMDYNYLGMFKKFREFSMRRIFGARKIKKEILKKADLIPLSFSTEQFERCFGNCIIPGVSLHPIGIKDDIIRVLGNYTQEML